MMTSKGYKHPPEMKAHISRIVKAYWRDPQYRAEKAAMLAENARQPETRQKSRERMIAINKTLDRKKSWETRRARKTDITVTPARKSRAKHRSVDPLLEALQMGAR
jgi:hypothetical protein